MRSDNEMLKAVHDRANEMLRKQRRRRDRLLAGAVLSCAAAVIVLTILAVPSLTGKNVPASAASVQAGLLADSGILGYAAVCIVSFLLGIAVTVFCLLLRKKRNTEEKPNDRNH